MSCERFKIRLAEFALGTDDAEFRAHLDACPSCHAELDTQRALLDAIDRGVASMVQEEPSGDFAAQIRRRIAESAAAPRPWFAGWQPITAAAALAVVAIVAFLMIGRPPRPPQSAQEQPSALVAPAEKPREAAPPEMARTEAPRKVAIGHRPPREEVSASNREPEVLVPRGEMTAVLRLFNANWSGKVDGASLTSQPISVSEALKPMTFEEMKIPALEIVPLESGEPSKGAPEK